MNIGSLFVSLQVDAKPLKSGVQEASSALDGLGSAAKKLGGVLAGVFAAQQVISFGRDTIQTFAEADQVWNRLGGTLNTVGVSFAGVRGEIERAARALQDVSTVGDEDFAQSLQTMVRISGDYQGSLRNVTVAADLAAGAQIDLDTASQLVGKAMVGNTAALARYGIVVKEGENAIDALARRFKGMAENEARTFNGQLAQISNEVGDLREAIGAALVGMGGMESVLPRIRDGFKSLATWVNENAGLIRGLGGAVVDFASWVARDIGASVKQFLALRSAIRDIKREFGFGERLDVTTRGLAADPADLLAPMKQAQPLILEGITVVARRAQDTNKAIRDSVKTTTEQVKTWFNEQREILKRPLTPQQRLDQAQPAGGNMPAAFENLGALSGALNELAPPLRFASVAAEQMRYAMSLAGQGVREAAGYMIGGLNQFASNAISAGSKMMSAGVGFAAAGPAGLAFAAIMEVIGGVFEVVGPLINGILTPLRALGQVIGHFLAPVFRVLAIAASYLAEGLYRTGSFILSGIGKLMEGIGRALNALPGSLGNPLIALGTSMRTQAAALEDSAKAQQDYRKELIHGAEAVHKLTSSVINAVQGFNVTTHRNRALSGGGALPPSTPRELPPRAGGVTVDFHPTIHVGDSPDSRAGAREMLLAAERAFFVQASPEARALALQFGRAAALV